MIYYVGKMPSGIEHVKFATTFSTEFFYYYYLFFNHETHMYLKSNLLNQIGPLNHIPCGAEFVINLDSSAFNLPCLNNSKQIVFSSRSLQNEAPKNPEFFPNGYEFHKILIN